MNIAEAVKTLQNEKLFIRRKGWDTICDRLAISRCPNFNSVSEVSPLYNVDMRGKILAVSTGTVGDSILYIPTWVDFVSTDWVTCKVLCENATEKTWKEENEGCY